MNEEKLEKQFENYPNKSSWIKETALFFWELFKIVVISLAIIIPIRYFLIQPFYVKGSSMEPSFYDREYLVVDELSFHFHKLKRGDVIVFRNPIHPQDYFIKRLIGLPGETVEIKNGSVYIYNEKFPKGKRLKEPYLSKDLITYSPNKIKFNIGKDEYFVLGDNRIFSFDSRNFGLVPRKDIIGRVFFRGWPFNKIKIFRTIKY